MPRRNNNNSNANVIEINTDTILNEMYVNKDTTLVSDALKNKYYELKNKVNEKIECCVCYDEITCIHCLALCRCGNTLHLYEWLKCKGVCPMCRSAEQ